MTPKSHPLRQAITSCNRLAAQWWDSDEPLFIGWQTIPEARQTVRLVEAVQGECMGILDKANDLVVLIADRQIEGFAKLPGWHAAIISGGMSHCVLFVYNEDGWNPYKVLDAGTCYFQSPSDALPTRFGGKFGDPISGIGLLDGAGGRLGKNETPVELPFNIHAEKDFAALKLF